jgi:hypothetical protein
MSFDVIQLFQNIHILGNSYIKGFLPYIEIVKASF